MKKYMLGIVGLVLMIVVASSGCTSNDNFSSNKSSAVGTPSNNSTSVSDSNLQIVSSKMVSDGYGGYTVKGQAKNIGSETLGYASIDVKFYDKNGDLLDSSFDNINNLAPGETWNFKAYYYGDGKPAKYVIAPGSSF
ncbi:FxLYD domain-containing protein [Methanobacterium sp.]|uniref:FxLYD domain-containing protein n=1 Tax=Methanobacterium sp. TaxID=2164 RepID=UPI003C73DD2B